MTHALLPGPPVVINTIPPASCTVAADQRGVVRPQGEMCDKGAFEVEMQPAGLVDPSTGFWRLRNTAGVVTQFFYGVPGDYPFVGDWDCSSTDTPGLYRQSDGFAYLRNSNTQGIADLTFFFGNPGDVPIAGDFNGNGCDTLSIYRPSEARFYIINQLGQNGGGLGAADYSFLFGDVGDKPVVGDWDGDGIDEVGLHRESTGFFYYRNTLSTGMADGQFYFGDPGDRFVAGDWGAVDGADTPGVVPPFGSDVLLPARPDAGQRGLPVHLDRCGCRLAPGSRRLQPQLSRPSRVPPIFVSPTQWGRRGRADARPQRGLWELEALR